MTAIHPLRPYQATAIADLRAELGKGSKRIILQLATGSGKTRIAAEIVRLASHKRRKVLFLAPRRELIYQARDALERQGVNAGLVMAGEMSANIWDVQVASFDTLHARGMRKKSIRMPPADLVIVDEAHLSLAKTRKDIIEHYAEASVIGLTATPARGDGRGMGELYQAIVCGPTVRELTEQGYLVPVKYFAPSKPDLAAVGLTKDGDYAEGELGEVMDQPELIGDIVQNWLRLAPNRRTVVFCVNCAHSRHIRDQFLSAGISAEHVDGTTPAGERADIFERVTRGATQVLCNVFVASYGLDIPVLDCAVLARPTKNITLFLQTCGRVLRTDDGKTDALIIDHAGAIEENGFVDDFIPWSLDSKKKIRERIEEFRKQKAEPRRIECKVCHTMFSGVRTCPSCGHQCIPSTEAIPVYEADLIELKRNNREADWETKAAFIGGLRTHAEKAKKSDGWVAHKYRAKFGVWPNDDRVRNAPPAPVTAELRAWITSQNIRFAKRRAA